MTDLAEHSNPDQSIKPSAQLQSKPPSPLPWPHLTPYIDGIKKERAVSEFEEMTMKLPNMDKVISENQAN